MYAIVRDIPNYPCSFIAVWHHEGAIWSDSLLITVAGKLMRYDIEEDEFTEADKADYSGRTKINYIIDEEL